MERPTLVASMESRLGAILADIGQLVRCESPSAVPEAVKASADLVAVAGGAHADHEHVLVAALPGRAALPAALIDDILSGGTA